MKNIIILLAIGFLGSLAANAQQDTAIVRTFGGPYYEEGRQIIECADGGYAVIGTTGSDQSNNTNFYLLRLDEELNCMWNRNYGGAEVEWGYSIVEDANGNFLLCGYTNSFGEGGYDILVYKVDPLGNIIWQHTYGGSDWDFAYKMIAHPDNGFLICGKTYSYGNGGSDAYLLHISDDGNLLNEWTYGGEGDDEFRDMDVLSESSIAICGSIEDSALRKASVWLIALSNGEIEWQRIDSNDQYDYYSTAIDCAEDVVYVCGVKGDGGDNSSYGYTLKLGVDGEFISAGSTDINPPSHFYDIQLNDDYLYVVGKVFVSGYGSYASVIYKFDNNGYFLQGMVYGDSAEGEFNSIIVSDSTLTCTGLHHFFESSDPLLITMYYNRELLSNSNISYEAVQCLTVGVDNFDSDTLEQEHIYTVLNSIGQVIFPPKCSTISKIILNLDSGFYVIKSSDDQVIKKVLKQ